ncbi:helix-turn-helix transcriptional regulator [Bacillus cereus]|uniref:XRE family transcriptional regulator n=1 Tax=Bacillus cereus TaxID=1396 RepID=A0A9W7Q6M9_BACCE|nr:AimR family lysis-lysogeny pheromone receptor [Bacillus cereus]KAA6470439.1 XRE family transcriptional regulator [Bacillus cereus]KAB2393600.1 helix-turn-helix transcriptional regulator [Bacillus cereus]KAB2421234.1 helix-turn-helix transcriptional regulator [Bacillus cereus]KAB2462553.1 helix-turn-helix transcriptional regulator [Bacillus cereus]KAB2499956.1 helix-turn-helix transcriptional regulator [Bacillus cereus]
MKPLHIEVCNMIEDDENLTFTDVAELLGVSIQYISKFKNKGIIGFCKLLKISYILTTSAEEQRKVMSDWCLKLEKTEAIKQSFEYATITRNISLLEKLLGKYKHENGTIKEYVSVYKILYNYIINEIQGNKLIDEIQTIGLPTDSDLRILMNIMKCYNYYFSKEFVLMLGVAQEAEKQIMKLKGERKLFIKQCYIHRIAEVLGPAYLRLNNLEAARHYAYIIKHANISKKMLSDSLYTIGMSYLTENKEQCINFLKKSYKEAKMINEKPLEVEAKCNLEMAEMYYELVDSDRVKSMHFIMKMEEMFYQRENEDFIKFFKAACQESNIELHKCLREFFTQSNYLFSSLIAKELYRRGEQSMVIEWMIDFKKERGDGYFEKDSIDVFHGIITSNNRFSK